MEPTFFASPTDMRRWFERHHATASELLVGFHKVGTGTPSITWPESVDEALCFGWIDGIRRRIDDTSYTIRFTPRKPGSNWSAVNVRRAEALIREGRMCPAGLAAFEKRAEARTGVYSFEQRHELNLPPEFEERLRADPAAWEYWQACPPGYRATATWWVVSAKRTETRERRLGQLVEHSGAGRKVPPLG